VGLGPKRREKEVTMWSVSWPNCLSASRSASLTALSWVIMPTADVAIIAQSPI